MQLLDDTLLKHRNTCFLWGNINQYFFTHVLVFLLLNFLVIEFSSYGVPESHFTSRYHKTLTPAFFSNCAVSKIGNPITPE